MSVWRYCIVHSSSLTSVSGGRTTPFNRVTAFSPSFPIRQSSQGADIIELPLATQHLGPLFPGPASPPPQRSLCIRPLGDFNIPRDRGNRDVLHRLGSLRFASRFPPYCTVPRVSPCDAVASGKRRKQCTSAPEGTLGLFFSFQKVPDSILSHGYEIFWRPRSLVSIGSLLPSFVVTVPAFQRFSLGFPETLESTLQKAQSRATTSHLV